MTKHAWSGQLDPGKHTLGTYRTFSVGIYELVPRSNGKGTKRGKVKVRVGGTVSAARSVYAKADEIVARLDSGMYTGPRTVRV